MHRIKTKYIVLTTLLIIVISTGIYFTINYKPQLIPVTSTIVSIPGWDVYQDNRHGYRFQHPREYACSGESCGRQSDHLFIRLVPIFTTKDNLYDTSKIIKMINEKSVPEIINQRTWYKTYGIAGYNLMYATITDGLTFGFGADDISQEELLKQMVSTFELIQLPYERVDRAFNKLKVGDTFGSFTITDLNGFKIEPLTVDTAYIKFSGETTLRGFYFIERNRDGEALCINQISKDDLIKLPHIYKGYDYGKTKLCFDYYAYDKSVLKEATGQIAVKIDNLSMTLYQTYENQPDFSAQLISIDKIY